MIISLRNIPAYYINLDHMNNRNKHMENLLDISFKKFYRVPAFDRAHVVPTKKTQKLWAEHEVSVKHSVAVARSHIKALSSIARTPAIIFEDDIEIIEYKNTLKVPKNADIVYLGFVPLMMTDSTNNNFKNINFSDMKAEWAKIDKTINFHDCYKVHGMICCHAMLYVTDRAVKRAIEVFQKSEKTGIPIDVLSSELMQELNVYVTKKTLFGQKDSPDTFGHAKDFKPAGDSPMLELVV